MLESATFWTAAEVFVHEADVDKVKPDKERVVQELCFFARSKLIFSLNVFANTWVTLGVTEQQALHRKSLA